MRIKDNLIVAIAFAAMLVLNIFAHMRLEACSSGDGRYRLHAASLAVPSVIVEAMAGEFKGLAADYLLLEAGSFLGSRYASQADQNDWDAVARLLEQSNKLDPYFRQTYMLTQSVLPWQTKKLPEALSILERSKKHLPWDWIPGYYIGFDYYFFINDNATAARYLMESSRVPGAPIALATLASRLASRSGSAEAAIEFLKSILVNTKNEGKKEMLKVRISALEGVVTLQQAMDKFKAQFGHLPKSLNELVESSNLTELPVNPYGRPYTIKDGVIDF